MNLDRKKNKGFTLIELLAVILILAIIALIAVPVVTKLVYEARKESFSTSTKNLIKVVENKCNKETLLSDNYTEKYIFEDGTSTESIPDLKGDLPVSGTIYIHNDCNAVADNIASEKFCSKGTAEDLLVYSGSCDVGKPTCTLKVSNGTIGVNNWYGEDVEVEMTSSQAGNSGLKYGIGINENYTKEAKAGTVGTLTYKITNSENSTINCYVKSNTNNSGTNSISINLDKTKPTKADFIVVTTTNAIAVTASGEDKESGISMYSFSKDDGKTWTTPNKSKTYTFTNLISGTYPIKVRVYNGTYTKEKDLNNYLDSSKKDISTNEIGVPTFTIVPEKGYATSKTVTITYPKKENNFIFQYSTDEENFEELTEGNTKDVVFTKNGYLIARVYDGTNYKTASTYTVSGIDTTNPTEASIKVVSKTTNTVSVIGSGTDNESGIVKYEFAIDSGLYVDNGNNANYVFTKVKEGNHVFKVRVTNGSGLTKEVSTDDSPNTLTPPTYSIDKTGWQASKTVTINYPSGYTNEYSIDNEKTWLKYTGPITFTNNGNIIARVYDGTNYKSSSTYTVSQIDSNPPTITTTKNNAELIVGASTNIINSSNNSDYFSISANGNIGISTVCKNASGTSLTNTSTLGIGEHAITCVVTKENGLTATASTNIIIKSDVCGVDNIGEIIGGYICSTSNPDCFTCPSGKSKVQLSDGNWTCK